MSWTEKYVTNSGAGAADGSSLANAWSWATMLTSLSAGQRANVQGAITRTTATDSFTNAGTAASPMAIRGINSTAGDLEANGRTRGGALVTTNFPTISYTSGSLSLPANMIAEHLAVTRSGTGTTVNLATGVRLRRCSISGTHATSASSAAISGVNSSVVIDDCDATLATSSSSASLISGSCQLLRSLLIAAGGKIIGSSTTVIAVVGCMIRDSGAGFSFSGTSLFVGNSFRNVTGICLDCAGSQCYATNNVAWGTGTGASQWYNSSTSVRVNYQSNNFIGNFATADVNEGDWPVISETALTADPFTSSSDLTLNSVAGGGAAVKAAAYPAYLDAGAWQTQAAGGTPAFGRSGALFKGAA